MAKKMVTIRLSPANARLVALNIDGWLDAGACEGGLEPDENKALHSAYDQILRGLGGKLSRAHVEALESEDTTQSVISTQMRSETREEMHQAELDAYAALSSTEHS